MSYPHQFGLGEDPLFGDDYMFPYEMDIDNDFGSTQILADGGIVSSVFGEIKDPVTTEVEVQDILTPSSIPGNPLFSNRDTATYEKEPISFENMDTGILPPLPDNYQVVLNHDPCLAFNFYDHPRSIPDLTKERMHKIPGIMRIYYDYHRAYSEQAHLDPQAIIGKHMARADVLAITLLEHFFPPSQRFIVKEVPTFPTVANTGWSLQLKGAVPFHRIPAEQIICFMVLKNYDMTAEDGTHSEQSFPHTYLTVLVDDLATIAQWQPDNTTNNRGDIMAYSMGVRAKIQTGYGIVIIGPRIEFYKYDNDSNKPMQRLQKDNWAFDMRTESPAMVGQTFEFVAAKTVVYQNGVLGGGAQRVVMGPPGLPAGRA